VDKIPISRFSLMTRLSQKALRLYDKKSLLEPAAKNSFTGYRYYTISQIERGIRIKNLARLGFGLDEIATFLEAEERGEWDVLEALRRQRRTRLGSELERLENVRKALTSTDRMLEVLNMKVPEPEIKDIPETRVVSKREKGSYERTVGKLAGELMDVIFNPDNQRKNVWITGPVMMLGHDEEYRETDADIGVAVPISGRITVDESSIEIRTLPQVRAISVIHKGPYRDIDKAYVAVLQFAAEKGLTLVLPYRELYLNNPNKVPEEELMTELQFPVAETPETGKPEAHVSS
jgi:effector-binding domain-containing protein